MEERSRRIAKNTILLYIRTFIVMIIGLYTGRVTLEALGVNDYGIYNVIGGIIGMSSLITAMLSGAGSRHLTYTLGQGNVERVKVMFSTISIVQFILGIIIVIFLEIGGIWFLNSTAKIPEGSYTTAHWVLQFSIITLFLNIISTQYSSLIIAYEKMNVFAYINVLESLLKLGIVLLILKYGGNRLIFYSFCQLLVAIVLRGIYYIYCHKVFCATRGKWIFKKEIVKQITNFAGWNFIQHSCWVFSTQGISLIINSFFGVAMNTARGLALTVSGAFQGFVGSFTMAYNPQITKSYASGDYEYCYKIANKGTKFTIYMMLIFIVPLFAEAETVLKLWLIDVPEYTVLFLKFTLFEALSVQSGQTLLKVIEANGNIKKNSIQTAFVVGWIFPLTWIAYKIGLPVWSNYIVFITAFIVVDIVRIHTLTLLTSYSINDFVMEVLKPVCMVMILSFIPPIVISSIWNSDIIRFVVCTPIYILTTGTIIYLIGINKSERCILNEKIKVLYQTFKQRNNRNFSSNI